MKHKVQFPEELLNEDKEDLVIVAVALATEVMRNELPGFEMMKPAAQYEAAAGCVFKVLKQAQGHPLWQAIEKREKGQNPPNKNPLQEMQRTDIDVEVIDNPEIRLLTLGKVGYCLITAMQEIIELPHYHPSKMIALRALQQSEKIADIGLSKLLPKIG